MRRKFAIFHSGRFFEFCIIMQYSILSRTFNLLFLPVLCHFSLPILVLHDEGAVRGFPYQILTVFFNRKIYIKFLSLHDRCPHVFFNRVFCLQRVRPLKLRLLGLKMHEKRVFFMKNSRSNVPVKKGHFFDKKRVIFWGVFWGRLQRGSVRIYQ